MAETVGSILGNHVGKGRYLDESQLSKEVVLGEYTAPPMNKCIGESPYTPPFYTLNHPVQSSTWAPYTYCTTWP